MYASANIYLSPTEAVFTNLLCDNLRTSQDIFHMQHMAGTALNGIALLDVLHVV